ncbi:MAG: MscL family protein [Candidatus Saccharibacteria bacterium]|nr:MscL family protein [Candidatus Saccharibacteria bacterium]
MAEKKATKKPALKKPSVAALKAKAASAKQHGGGFMEFIRTQGVVGLAVGLAIGTAAGDTVKKLVAAFIDPLVQLIIGSQEGLQAASFTVEVAGRKGEFLYGAFISSLITLLAVAFVVYAIIHFLKLDKLDKKKD